MLKKLLKFVIFLSLLGFLNAQPSIFDMMKKTQNEPQIEENTTSKPGSYLTKEQLESITGGSFKTNITNATIFTPTKPQGMILSVNKLPRFVYEYQIYSLNFRANTQNSANFDLNLTIQKNEYLKWLNPQIKWIKDGFGIYETTLFFQAIDKKAKLQSINLELSLNGETKQKSSFYPKMPEILSIKSDKNFSHIVANELNLKKHKTTEFDDNFNLTTINFEIKNGDLSSFFIDSIPTKQGVENIKGNYERSQGYYFVVLDKNISELNFSYFDLKNKKLQNYKIEIKAENDAVSTQSGLNPKESEFEAYKTLAIYFSIAILLLIFLFSRNILSLVFALAICIFALYLNKEYKNGLVFENSVIRILPTQNSTSFYTTKKDEKVEIFATQNGYKKIMLKDGKIGWVKDEFIKED